MTTVTLDAFLLDKEIRHAAKLYRTLPQHLFAHAVATQIIEPNLPRINAALGQRNDPRYLAYLVMAAMLATANASGSRD